MTETLMSSAEKLSSAEKRKNFRRSISYPAFIDLGDGSPAIECTLCDASQEGALLAGGGTGGGPRGGGVGRLPARVGARGDSPGALRPVGPARRRCGVAWRTENQVGAEFLKD